MVSRLSLVRVARCVRFTSNKSYGKWGEIFKDHVIAAAILDRILYHCTTVNIKGDSYRLKDRKRQGLIPKSLSELDSFTPPLTLGAYPQIILQVCPLTYSR